MNDIIFYSLIFMIGIFISSVSQILLKKSANIKYSNSIHEYLNINVILAYSMFVISTLFGIYSYKYISLGLGQILAASEYIFVTVMGKIFLCEKINKRKLLGLTLIVFGIIVFFI